MKKTICYTGIMYDAKWGTYKKIMDYLEDV